MTRHKFTNQTKAYLYMNEALPQADIESTANAIALEGGSQRPATTMLGSASKDIIAVAGSKQIHPRFPSTFLQKKRRAKAAVKCHANTSDASTQPNVGHRAPATASTVNVTDHGIGAPQRIASHRLTHKCILTQRKTQTDHQGPSYASTQCCITGLQGQSTEAGYKG